MKRIKKTSFLGGVRYLCAHCGVRVGYLDEFCSACGTPIEWETCPYCGHISETMNDGFCRDCGTAPLRRKVI